MGFIIGDPCNLEGRVISFSKYLGNIDNFFPTLVRSIRELKLPFNEKEFLFCFYGSESIEQLKGKFLIGKNTESRDISIVLDSPKRRIVRTSFYVAPVYYPSIKNIIDENVDVIDLGIFDDPNLCIRYSRQKMEEYISSFTNQECFIHKARFIEIPKSGVGDFLLKIYVPRMIDFAKRGKSRMLTRLRRDINYTLSDSSLLPYILKLDSLFISGREPNRNLVDACIEQIRAIERDDFEGASAWGKYMEKIK